MDLQTRLPYAQRGAEPRLLAQARLPDPNSKETQRLGSNSHGTYPTRLALSLPLVPGLVSWTPSAAPDSVTRAGALPRGSGCALHDLSSHALLSTRVLFWISSVAIVCSSGVENLNTSYMPHRQVARELLPLAHR